VFDDGEGDAAKPAKPMGALLKEAKKAGGAIAAVPKTWKDLRVAGAGGDDDKAGASQCLRVPQMAVNACRV